MPSAKYCTSARDIACAFESTLRLTNGLTKQGIGYTILPMSISKRFKLSVCAICVMTAVIIISCEADSTGSTGQPPEKEVPMFPYVCTNGQAARGLTTTENTERCASCSGGRIVNAQFACGQPFVRTDSVTDDDALIAAAMDAGTTPLPIETLFLNGGIAVTSAVIGSTTYLFAGAEAEGADRAIGNRGLTGGINVFRVSSTGELTRVAGVNGGTGLTEGISALAVATIGTNTYLYASSQGGIRSAGGGSVQMFSVAVDGTLTAGTTTSDSDTINLFGARDLAVAAIGQTTYLFVAGIFDNGISVFSIANNGALTNTDNVSDADNLYLDEVDTLTTAVVGTTTYLFTGASGSPSLGSGDNGISVFSVSSDGELTRTDGVADDAGTGATSPYLDRVRSLTTIEVDGTTYLYAASFGESALQIYSVSALGKLTAAGSLIDQSDNSPGSSTLTRQLEGVGAVQAVSVGGTGYVFAGGRDNGMSMFAVGSTGRLTDVMHIVEASTAATAALQNAELAADGLHLREINGMHTAFVGGSPYLFVINGYTGSASAMLSADSGINVFAIGKK